MDETRLAQEVAFLAERRDLSEELARLDSHLAQFQETLARPRSRWGANRNFCCRRCSGRPTPSAPRPAIWISQAVLEIKGFLERLREQVQNIE